MNCLLVNYPESACGVSQYGRNLWENLRDSTQIHWKYCEPSTVGELHAYAMPSPDAILYNWQSGQGGFLTESPFSWIKGRQFLCYHDNDINESVWAGIFFSDPGMTPHGNWHPIGRPLPKFESPSPKFHEVPIIGCHGFIGAWADQVVSRVIGEIEFATIRLNLPFAKYGDSTGAQARTMAEHCRNMVLGKPDIKLEISHDFLPMDKLLAWLSENDLNCYIRPANMNWRGVSSAPDAAIAVKRPIAINRCNAFRHLHFCTPSICVEDNSLLEIIGNGLSPTTRLRVEWSPENIRQQIESVLQSP